MNNKKSIRTEVREVLSQITKQTYEDYSYTIACQLFKEQEWKQAQVVGVTVSKYPEVDTYQIIRKAWETGKQVVVPKCIPAEKKLVFRTITEFSQLECVFHGLLEPIEALTKAVKPGEIDLLIVPGLAYTREGCRIGFGGGYYDRYLPHFSGHTLSLAFPEQLIPHFPADEHDIPVQKIITVNEVIKIR